MSSGFRQRNKVCQVHKENLGFFVFLAFFVRNKMYLQKHITTAAQLIKQYPYPLPFAIHLKQYFTLNKKHGSKDRKFIAQACFAYLRLGKNLPELALEEKIMVGIFISPKAQDWKAVFKEDWQHFASETLDSRIAFIQTIYPNFSISNLFFWEEELSPLIDKHTFALSHLLPTKAFLRLRPKHAEKVEAILQQSNIIYQKINNQCLAFSEAIDFQKLLQLNRQAVVQDFSSGQVLNYFADNKIEFKQPITVWDCCAASGGKSILATDSLPIKKIVATDVRPTIINNLNQRFKEAGISNFQSFIVDAAKGKFSTDTYDMVIADCPCTGSGTWGRNPENLVNFSKESIAQFSTTQKIITKNVAKTVKPNGYFVYITCSVFAKENEEVVQHILANTGFSLKHQQLILGYEKQADTMFVAVFKNETT